MIKKLALYLIMTLIMINIWGLVAQKIDLTEETVNIRIKSKLFSDVTWIGCLDGLLVYYHSSGQVWRMSNYQDLVIISNVIDLYEQAGDDYNTVNLYLFNGQVQQLISIDGGQIFFTSDPQSITTKVWLEKKLK